MSVGKGLGASDGTAVRMAGVRVGVKDGNCVGDSLNTAYAAVNPGPDTDASEMKVTRMSPYRATNVCRGRRLPENEPISISVVLT